ncbi:MAG: hypothetical protein JO020_08120 [Chloroflexi bacterium]|nr:hypothetical protein [Chloroflexota bacterium]
MPSTTIAQTQMPMPSHIIRDGLLALEAMNQRAALVVVDFIQMIQDQAETSRADWAHYGEPAKRLKLIAEEFGVPIVAASRLNRASEYEKRPPTLADFSLSDQIVQYADSVIALYREKDDAGGSRTFVPILKRRNYGRPAGEALEVVWSGQKYTDPHPPEHYRHLLHVAMTTAPLPPNRRRAKARVQPCRGNASSFGCGWLDRVCVGFTDSSRPARKSLN